MKADKDVIGDVRLHDMSVLGSGDVVPGAGRGDIEPEEDLGVEEVLVLDLGW